MYTKLVSNSPKKWQNTKGVRQNDGWRSWEKTNWKAKKWRRACLWSCQLLVLLAFQSFAGQSIPEWNSLRFFFEIAKMLKTSCKVKSKNKLLVQQQQRPVSHLSVSVTRGGKHFEETAGVAIEFQFGWKQNEAHLGPTLLIRKPRLEISLSC